MKETITEIREVRGGLRVTLSDQSTLRLTRRDQKTFFFKEGDTLEPAEFKHDLLLQQYPNALNSAVRLLAVRARSTAELEKRLGDAGYLDDTVEMVLTKLQNEKLLDDEAFARQWAGDRAARQMGRARILQELRRKGVAEETSEQVLMELDPQQQDAGAAALAAKLLKRYRSLPAQEARRKAIMAMQRRGYGYAEARDALGQGMDTDDWNE